MPYCPSKVPSPSSTLLLDSSKRTVEGDYSNPKFFRNSKIGPIHVKVFKFGQVKIPRVDFQFLKAKCANELCQNF